MGQPPGWAGPRDELALQDGRDTTMGRLLRWVGPQDDRAPRMIGPRDELDLGDGRATKMGRLPRWAGYQDGWAPRMGGPPLWAGPRYGRTLG